MKKIVSVLLVLSLALTLAFAVAEESSISTYVMAAAVDADGNYVDITTADLPVLVMVIDGASNKCAFGTEEEAVEGTYEIVTGEDGVLVLTMTLSDGTEAVMFYVVEDDAWMIVDVESGLSMFLFNVESLEEAA